MLWRSTYKYIRAITTITLSKISTSQVKVKIELGYIIVIVIVINLLMSVLLSKFTN